VSGTELSFTPSPHEVGLRVDAVAARRASAPRAVVARAVRAGAVTVAGRAVRPSHRLSDGDVVEGRIPEVELRPPQAEAIPVPVVHSDARVLVVSKPAGLVTHPATRHASGTLVNALLALGEPLAARDTRRPGIVHRLDKDTSGLLLVAKDDDALAFLQDALRARAVERGYLALVRGRPSSPRGTVDAPLGRHPARPRLRAVVAGGKPAVTHFRVVGGDERLSLLDVTLDSGRTHQIRVHLAHLGHPVLGDRVYGGGSELASSLGLARPFLHAYRLSWPDPGGEGRRTVTVDLPDELSAALGRARVPRPASLWGA
jgi:23S rRNA pseudouridine1911/1915/1917 synthase